MNNNQRSTKIKCGSTGRALKAAILIFSTWMLLVSCRTGSTESNPTDFSKIEDEEYDVFSALLHGKEKDRLTIIEDTTVPFSVIDERDDIGGGLFKVIKSGSVLKGYNIQVYIDEIGYDTLENFEAKNVNPVTLEYKFNLINRYLLIKKIDEFERYRIEEKGRDFWGEFHSFYPAGSGIISFSRVGFNRKKSKALVYVGSQSGPLSGIGGLIYLERVNGTWEIIKEINIWIS